jgi:O-methyltransferase
MPVTVDFQRKGKKRLLFRGLAIWLQKKLKQVLLNRKRMVFTRTPEILSRNDYEELLYLTFTTNDFVRVTTFILVVKDIEEQELHGCVAELGVFKGEFAAVMNRYFPERPLYLFDSFEGFNRAEFENDRVEGLSSYWQSFDTSIAEVMERMPHPDKVVIRKGFFPDTVDDIEESFVFVSIDVDLYQPTLNGLNYFFPRLATGGYIFVHDFNHSQYRGARKAVAQFCKENNDAVYVPVCDWGGTGIIKKH